MFVRPRQGAGLASGVAPLAHHLQNSSHSHSGGDRPAPHSNHGYFASHQFISSDSSVAPSGAPPAAQTVMGMQTLMYYDSNSTQTRHLSLPIQTYPNNTPVTRADLNVTDPTSAARPDCSHPSVALQVSCSGFIRWPRNGYTIVHRAGCDYSWLQSQGW